MEFDIILTEDCNLNCVYCYEGDFNKADIN